MSAENKVKGQRLTALVRTARYLLRGYWPLFTQA